MALAPSLRFVTTHFFTRQPRSSPIVDHFFSNPPPKSLSSLPFLQSRKPFLTTSKPLVVSRGIEHTLVLNSDERALGPGPSDSEQSEQLNSSTIAAIVTSIGGAVGIVRLSGPTAVKIAGRVFKPAGKKASKKKRERENIRSWRPASHVVEYGSVFDSRGNVVDEVIAVPMLAPRSYTREDVVELQCHGSDVCLHRVLRACLEAGAQLAEPGEFTLRAFLNGRLDLSQAENVGKLISAKSVAAADAALAGLQGGFSCLVRSLRASCIELLTEIEARLDFEDEMPPIDLNLIMDKINVMELRGLKLLQWVLISLS